MKSSKFLTLSLLPFMMLASCSDGEHKHSPSSEWSRNKTHHWHECSGCDEHLDEAEHTFGEWQSGTNEHWACCTECDYLYKTNHIYDQEVVADKYLATAATCNTPAFYYHSCVCGAKGTTVFSYGEATGHHTETEWSHDATYHWHACENCEELVDKATHVFDQKVISTATKAADATCDKHTTYYYSCVCGAISTILTFEDEESALLPHQAGTALFSDETGHWNLCGDCHEKVNFESHTMVYQGAKHNGQYYSFTEKCSVCDYVQTYSVEDGKGYTVTCSKAPTTETAGELKFTPEETSKQTFTLALPSFAEDLAKNKDEQIYVYNEVNYANGISYNSGYARLKYNNDDAIFFAKQYGYTNPQDIADIACSMATTLKTSSWNYYDTNNAGSDFCFLVQDVFTITGRGTVVAGNVISGSIKTGATVDLYSTTNGTKIDTIVTQIEYSREYVDEAKAGDSVGMALRGIDKSQVSIGDYIVNDGYKLQAYSKFIGEIRMYTKDEGGRTNGFSTGYRPQFHNGATDYIGTMTFDQAEIKPGEIASEILVETTLPMFVFDGMILMIKEGGRLVGTMLVRKVIDDYATYIYTNDDSFGDLGFNVCLTDYSGYGFYVDFGADGIELTSSDGDSASYLPEAVDAQINYYDTDLILIFYVYNQDGDRVNLFKFSSIDDTGWVSVQREPYFKTTLRMEACGGDEEYFGDMGDWSYGPGSIEFFVEYTIL